MFIIKDYLGDKPFGDVRFETIDGAWGYIVSYLSDQGMSDQEIDECCGDYIVVEADRDSLNREGSWHRLTVSEYNILNGNYESDKSEIYNGIVWVKSVKRPE